MISRLLTVDLSKREATKANQEYNSNEGFHFQASNSHENRIFLKVIVDDVFHFSLKLNLFYILSNMEVIISYYYLQLA